MPPAIPLGVSLRARYRIVQLLHQSRHANIYLAEDQHLPGHMWAVREMQLLAVDNFEKNRIMSQFHAEALRLSQLTHPTLARVLDFFVDGNNLYIVREYVHGSDLGHLLSSRAMPLSEREALQVITQIVEAITYIQSRKLPPVFFRELTAQNIIVAKTGSVKLVDLGLASVFQAGDPQSQQQVGSLDYASPEQFSEAGAFDQRSLVYSVGAILYHMLTRRNPALSPFALEPVEEINPNISEGVEDIVHRSTEIEPRDRYASLADLKKALQQAMKGPDAAGRRGSGNRSWNGGAPLEEGPMDAPVWNWILGFFLLALMSGALLAIYYYFFRQ